jgi:hypothetical protein
MIIYAHMYLEYRSAADKAEGRESRIVFCVAHQELFYRNRSQAVTPSSHALMAVERLVDIATLAAYQCIPRPCFLDRE